ncbi:MAG TPA: DUF1761 domain-containing protein [Pseudolabrys sp.]|nr:DUF1761 domain-containing protein [Pseudolabrys sp.]
MAFAGINYWAVLVAGAVGFIVGGVWYHLLSKPWMAAHGFTPEQLHGKMGTPTSLVVALIADIIMAYVLAGMMGHIGAVTLKNGVVSALFAWIGFVITTLTVNNTFGQRSPKLIVIDGGHWLIALLIMGAIIGVWGV